MIRNALVSVVIPTYNSEEYIGDCLEATLNQTYANIEVIIVDDGSKDSTVSICKKYADRDKRIRVFCIDGNGVSEARNHGISNAHGNYIVFFDADDCPETILIESYLNALEEWQRQGKKVSFVLCGMYHDNVLNRYVENKTSILENYYGYVEGENYLLRRNYAATLAWLKIFNFVTNKIYDVEKLRVNGICFDERVKIGEDLKFNLDYLTNCPGYIGMINKPLYHYIRRNEDCLSLVYHESDIEDTKAIYRRFLKWEMAQKGVTKENILVVKSIFITDWVSRLTTMHDHFIRKKGYTRSVREKLDDEIGCPEFKRMLKEVHRSHKISNLRYAALRTGRFGLFCFLRRIYQLAKG